MLRKYKLHQLFGCELSTEELYMCKYLDSTLGGLDLVEDGYYYSIIWKK